MAQYEPPSPSELKRWLRWTAPRVCVFLGQNWRFCALFGFRRLMPGGLHKYTSQSRTESSPQPRWPCALFAALQAKHHHHPQLVAQRCISAACAAFRACHQLRLLLLLRFYCRRGSNFGGRQRAEAREREREQSAKPELRLITRSPPTPLKEEARE
jgi:hypothetical protein